MLPVLTAAIAALRTGIFSERWQIIMKLCFIITSLDTGNFDPAVNDDGTPRARRAKAIHEFCSCIKEAIQNYSRDRDGRSERCEELVRRIFPASSRINCERFLAM